MKTTLILALSLHFLFGNAQNHFSYITLKKGKEYSFPIFNSSNKPAVKKINQLLQIAELELLKGYEVKHVFEHVMIDNGTIYGGKTDLEFEVHTNSSKILSLVFREASCGMTCTYYSNYYNFNPGNGDMIQLKDLFTSAGYKVFYEFVKKRRVSELRKEILKLPKEGQKFTENIVESYQNDDLSDFYIKNGVLYIDGENSFHKNQKFSGMETISKFSVSEFSKYLNAYGRSLFLKTQDNIGSFHSSGLPQLFKGTIGDEEILMVLKGNANESIYAEYVYLKYGTGIFLEGEWKDNKILLTEHNNKSAEEPSIELKLAANKITGTWTNGKKTKSYPISAVKN
jgi:hypothetical protein